MHTEQLNPAGETPTYLDPNGVVFDFDGTVADTRSSIISTFEETFRRLELPYPGEDVIAATIGIPLHISFQVAADMSETESEAATAVYREVFKDRELADVHLFDGMRKVLDELSRRGMPLAIASSRSRPSLSRLLDYLGLTHHFSVVAGREDAAREKPYPDLLLGVARALGIEPQHLLVVGDTTFDIEMAHNAGAFSCAVRYGNHSADALAGVNPTVTIDAPVQLLQLLAPADVESRPADGVRSRP
ncbi:MAG: HAD-IA family hydrolase [Spirochaetes bacterium]|jgi:phosphoglycolate phosphatase|nr:HAD-IA family hydrolase [Spirochaetota bacterium]